MVSPRRSTTVGLALAALAALIGAFALRQVVRPESYASWRYVDVGRVRLWQALADQGLFRAVNRRAVLDEKALEGLAARCRGAWDVPDQGRVRRPRAREDASIGADLGTQLAAEGYVRVGTRRGVRTAGLDRARLEADLRASLDGLRVEEGQVVVDERAFSRGLPESSLVQRGAILDRDGAVLAGHDDVPGPRLARRRDYPLGPAGMPLLGVSRFGPPTAGIERVAARRLTGTPHLGSPWLPPGYFQRPGDDLELSVDARLQRRAFEVLGRRGAAVVLDPRTGEILALASFPSADPNNLSSADYQALERHPDLPLLNRAVDQAYPPGSVFKPVVLAAALEEPTARARTLVVDCTGEGEFGIRCTAAHGRVTIDNALRLSCNTFFGRAAVLLGPYLRTVAERLGFNAWPEPLLPARMTAFPLAPTPSLALADLDGEARRFVVVGELGRSSDRLVAMCGIGQNRVAATPLQIASLTQVIASRGIWRAPRLASGTEGFTPEDRRLPRVVADEVRHQMESVWTSGTARHLPRVRFEGGRFDLEPAPGRAVRVGCKTGTAEVVWEDAATGRLLKKPPHSWFTAFAPAEQPEAVVTVFIENGGYGAEAAGRRAVALLVDALNRQESRPASGRRRP